jgi:hypothetical protein
MAGFAGCGEQARMVGWISMTGHTRGVYLLEIAPDMTLHTGKPCMSPRQWEVGQGMVEGDFLPCGGLMAGFTLHAIGSIVGILGGMTAIARRRNLFQRDTCMAVIADGQRMSIHKQKLGLRMIEGCIIPARCLVAGLTLVSKTPPMRIILLMARDTLRRVNCKLGSPMAVFTG